MKAKAQLLSGLSEREKEILVHLSKGLTDQQIADELFLSLNTIKWYNRQIYSKLGVSSRTQAIANAKDLGLLTHAHPALSLPEHTLPEQNSVFIGRDHEIAEIKQLITRCRLLTLTGTGGIGKTRLALRVAKELAETFKDGIYFIDLASVSDPHLVINAIARALDVIENSGEPLLETLKRVLTSRELLLFIDNFEHVIEAAPSVSHLLVACPNLKVLVTSREVLRLAGEQEYPVPPLSLPVAEVVTPQDLAESEAGALFVQRVQMTQPHFEVNNENAPAIARICARLDGLPLALELAAARCKLLSPPSLLERLTGIRESSPLHTLASGSRDAPARHRSLEDTVAWSYHLLDEEEKTLFARLAVFRGGRSLEAVEAVCCEDLAMDVLDGLASLVDKNLLQQQETSRGEPRFIFLEMIHEYARERLEERGEAEKMRQRHAEYFVKLAELAEPELRSSKCDDWIQLLELELDNIRAVFAWTLRSGSFTLGVRLGTALGQFFFAKGHHVEGLRWMQQLLEHIDDLPVQYHPKFLISASHLVGIVDLKQAQRLLRRALDISRALDDQEQIAWTLVLLGYAMLQEPEAAFSLVEEGLALFREMQHRPGIISALNIIGEIARTSGDIAGARRAYEECLSVCQQVGEARGVRSMSNNLAYLAQHEGDHANALVLGRQALLLSRESQDKRDICVSLGTIAGSLTELGQSLRAARLLGAAELTLERMGAYYHPSDLPEYQRVIALVRKHLDTSTFQAAWAEGRRMKLTQAIEEALIET